MNPTLSLHITPSRLYAAVVRPGSKGLRLEAVALVRRTDALEDSLAAIRQQLGDVQWATVTVVLDSNSLPLALFPIEQDQRDIIVREQLELEIVQQFLSTPSEGYRAEIFRVGPDAEGRYSGLAVCHLRQHQTVQDTIDRVLGGSPQLSAAIIATVASYGYNYPERQTKRTGIALIGEETVELSVLQNGAIQFCSWSPIDRSVDIVLQRMVRSALLHCGEVLSLYLAGSALTRQRYEQLVATFDGRFAEPVALLDGFRLLECNMPADVCRAAAPLGHVFAPTIGAALQSLYVAPHWTFATTTDMTS